MPVTATFALGPPTGAAVVLGLQPTILRPIQAPYQGNRSGGVAQHGNNWFVAEFTIGFDGETFITQAEAAIVAAHYHACKSTDGRRKVVFFDLFAASGAGGDVTAVAIMDMPEYELGLWGLFRGVRVRYRDVVI